MDRKGNMGMGYSVSNGNIVGQGEVYPGIRYTGRLVTIAWNDAAGRGRNR